MRHARSIKLIPDDFERLEPIDQAALRAMKADDLRQWECLGGECASCRRQGLVSKDDVCRRFHGRPLIDLQPLLHCTGCDNRQGNLFIVSAMARD